MTNTTTKRPFNKARDTLEQLCFNNILSKLYVRSRNTAVLMKTRKVPFITYCELLHDTLELAKTMPNTYDVIVGIPRSGMIPASVSSLLSGRPLSTPDSLAEDFAHLGKNQKMDQAPKRILLVDDGLGRRKGTIHQNYVLLKQAFPGSEIIRGGSCVSPRNKSEVDACHKITPKTSINEELRLESSCKVSDVQK